MRNLLILTMAALLLGGCGGGDTPTAPDDHGAAWTVTEHGTPPVGDVDPTALPDLVVRDLILQDSPPGRVGWRWKQANEGESPKMPLSLGQLAVRPWYSTHILVTGPDAAEWEYEITQLQWAHLWSNVAFDYPCFTPGEYTVTITVDSQGGIAEEDETNNTATLEYVVPGGLVDLAIAGLQMGEDSYQLPCDLDWYVHIRNCGYPAAPGVRFDLEARVTGDCEDYWFWDGGWEIPDPRQGGIVSHNVTPWDCAGACSLTVTLDPLDKIKELDETNNSRTIIFEVWPEE